MKFLIDFFPIALFFIVYKTYGLHMAIYAMIVATALQMGITRYQTGKFEKAHLITFGLLVVFGGVTIAINDPAFIMWKVSVLYVVFALALIASLWLGKKTLLERMLGKELELPALVWQKLTWLWGLGFVGIAIVNAHYVNLALSTRDLFFSQVSIDPKIELTELQCNLVNGQDLCLAAQQAEASWVNFKLFGTLGLTFALIVVTVLWVSKYIKEKS